jgi:hypothetical protein
LQLLQKNKREYSIVRGIGYFAVFPWAPPLSLQQSRLALIKYTYYTTTRGDKERDSWERVGDESNKITA